MKFVSAVIVAGVAMGVVMGIEGSKAEKSPAPATPNATHSDWLAASLAEMRTIKAGMSRAELLKVFQEEGGISCRNQRRYGYRGSPYIKVDVIFEPVGDPDKQSESPGDKITSISKPFLEAPIVD
jgi:hypothetical protein